MAMPADDDGSQLTTLQGARVTEAQVAELSTRFATTFVSYDRDELAVLATKELSITAVSAVTGSSYGLRLIPRQTDSGAFLGMLEQIDGSDVTAADRRVLEAFSGSGGTRHAVYWVGDGTLDLMAI